MFTQQRQICPPEIIVPSLRAHGQEPYIADEAFQRLKVWLHHLRKFIGQSGRHHELHAGTPHLGKLRFGHSLLQRQQVLCRDAISLVEDLPPAVAARRLHRQHP